jgi:serine/threonine protein kinase
MRSVLSACAMPQVTLGTGNHESEGVLQFTSTYSSPERSNACDQRKVDVWAAGCILHELCTGRPFIQARNERERFVLMAQFYDADWAPPRLPRSMACWQPLLNAMMARDAASRPLPVDLLAFDIFACAPPATSADLEL